MESIVEYIQEHVFENPQMMSNIYENYNVVKMYFEDKDIPDFCNELLTQNYSASYVINEYLKSVNDVKTIESLVENNCNDYIYKDCNGIVFHLTDKENVNKILKVGLRPKYVKHETINNLKDKQHNNIDYKGKIYVAAISDLSTIKYKIKEIKDKLFKNNNNVKVLKIRLPNNIDFYKDNAMYDDISYFTYTPIDSKYIEITNYQYILSGIIKLINLLKLL